MDEREYMASAAKGLRPTQLGDGGISTGKPTKPPGPVNDVHDAFQAAHELCRCVHTLAERLLGSYPGIGAAADQIIPDGFLNILAANGRALSESVSGAMDALNSINRNLP